jgi:hypothetical protein
MNISNIIIELEATELSWWEKTIREFRTKYIKDPKVYAKQIIDEENITVNTLKSSIEDILLRTRESVWKLYLIDEALFHKEVITHLIENRSLPKQIVTEIIGNNILSENLGSLNKEEIFKKIIKVVGDTAGRIMPYIYILSLSTTQSRRSRAGKVFERIIETFFDIFAYPYSNQSGIGNAVYNEKNLGKKVDLIVPNVESYLSNRPKCAVITMKTSLRERWQEVAEELNRTNVPHIYLLTVDDKVTENVVTLIKQYNITLVLYEKLKNKKFKNYSNVLSYNEFFNRELPHIISYWK